MPKLGGFISLVVHTKRFEISTMTTFAHAFAIVNQSNDKRENAAVLDSRESERFYIGDRLKSTEKPFALKEMMGSSSRITVYQLTLRDPVDDQEYNRIDSMSKSVLTLMDYYTKKNHKAAHRKAVSKTEVSVSAIRKRRSRNPRNVLQARNSNEHSRGSTGGDTARVVNGAVNLIN